MDIESYSNFIYTFISDGYTIFYIKVMIKSVKRHCSYTDNYETIKV